MSCNVVIGDPTATQHSAAQMKVGSRATYLHPSYGEWELEYTQFKDAVTYAAGQVVCWKDATRTSVTNDISGAIEARAAGIALMVHTENYYGYMLKRGYYPTLVTNADDDIAAGDTLIVDDNEDGQVDSVAGATDTGDLRFVGIALAADVDANDTVAAAVSIPL